MGNGRTTALETGGKSLHITDWTTDVIEVKPQEEVPDWLKNLKTSAAPSSDLSPAELPDWLANLEPGTNGGNHSTLHRCDLSRNPAWEAALDIWPDTSESDLLKPLTDDDEPKINAALVKTGLLRLEGQRLVPEQPLQSALAQTGHAIVHSVLGSNRAVAFYTGCVLDQPGITLGSLIQNGNRTDFVLSTNVISTDPNKPLTRGDIGGILSILNSGTRHVASLTVRSK